MTDTRFTGERLHAGSKLFQVDIARHRAAYQFAIEHTTNCRVLDLGCGSGYGTAELAESAPFVIGVDRITPDASARQGSARYIRADLNRIPLARACFDLVVSFQVIEHLPDPTQYLRAMTQVLKTEGTALVSTPNRLTSDGENPYHVREYEADELVDCLSRHFEEVEMRGVGTTPEVARYLESRLQRIRRITRLDPLRLRKRLPRRSVEWLFAAFARLVRQGIQHGEGIPQATWRDFPIGPFDNTCIDLFAICRRPRS